MLYDIIHCFGGHYKCCRRRPRHGGGGGGGTNPALPLAPPPGTAGGRGGAVVVAGAFNTAPGHSTMPATAIYSVIYNAFISYSIGMHIKHEQRHIQGHCACGNAAAYVLHSSGHEHNSQSLNYAMLLLFF